MTKPQIAFLGTGLMGGPMAANLLKAGFPVTAWNRTPAKAEALAPAGAHVAEAFARHHRDSLLLQQTLGEGSGVEARGADVGHHVHPPLRRRQAQ